MALGSWGAGEDNERVRRKLGMIEERRSSFKKKILNSRVFFINELFLSPVPSNHVSCEVRQRPSVKQDDPQLLAHDNSK